MTASAIIGGAASGAGAAGPSRRADSASGGSGFAEALGETGRDGARPAPADGRASAREAAVDAEDRGDRGDCARGGAGETTTAAEDVADGAATGESRPAAGGDADAEAEDGDAALAVWPPLWLTGGAIPAPPQAPAAGATSLLAAANDADAPAPTVITAAALARGGAGAATACAFPLPAAEAGAAASAAAPAAGADAFLAQLAGEAALADAASDTGIDGAIDALDAADAPAGAERGITLAAPAGPAARATAPPPAVPGAPVDLADADFGGEVGSRVHWIAAQRLGHAEIRLNPADLGPIDVRLRLDGDRIHADFSSAQADVRQAIEHNLPRLREQLAASGFQLAHAGVGGGQAEGGSGGGSNGSPQHGEAGAEIDVAPDPTPQASLRAVRLLDAYA